MAIDDHARIVFTAMHPNEKTPQAVQFLNDAVAYYASLGIRIQRLLTDNGSAFRARDFAAACQAHGIRHKFTRAYPNRPIRMVVPMSAGSSGDSAARAIAQKLSEILGKAIVVENKVGAGGRIGAAEAAPAPADGYTLLYGRSITQALYPAIGKNVKYDPIKDFDQLSQPSSNALASNSSNGVEVSRRLAHCYRV